MKKQGSHLSMWIIFNLVRISFWANAAIVAVFTISTILLAFGLSQNFHPEHYLPCKFDVVEKGSLTISNSKTLVTITDAIGRLEFDKLPANISLYISISLIPMFGALLLGLWLFKKFITNVKLGLLFKGDNIQYLKKFAYVLLAVWVYSKIVMIVLNLFILKAFTFDSVKIQFTVGSQFALYLSLFIWILSDIFQKGVEIEEENNLTI